MLQRAATREGAPVGAIAHSQVTEVYDIVSGSGTLVTGEEVVNQTPLPANGEIVKIAVGPSTNGTFRGGDRRVVSEGGVTIIPAGVPHGFTDVRDHVQP